ncbi:radial spoke head protein 9 [Lycorma delicatula]|uniref:radial spoke head protein 9 n=1 Tax=Lycorma delicatula TaxID=130591 RepID=UPI003F510A9E
MNIEDMLIGFETLSRYGITLSSEKRLVIYNSLILIKNDSHFKDIFLWGIVRGLNADFYIAYGYQKDALIGRIFYYSTNCIDWFLLPEPKLDDMQFALRCSSKFQGDPSFAVQIEPEEMTKETLMKIVMNEETEQELKPEEAEEAEGEGDGDAIKSEGKIKEEDRLAAVVYMINQEAFILPRGALYKRYDGVIIDNKAFEGLSFIEGDELRNYLHLRVPQEKWNTNMLTRNEYNCAIDFLDTIDADKPEGLWIMKTGSEKKILYLKHLLWQGYLFYHIMKTQTYGSFYSGDGRKNLDVPFMM